jgi:hypothetical protein
MIRAWVIRYLFKLPEEDYDTLTGKVRVMRRLERDGIKAACETFSVTVVSCEVAPGGKRNRVVAGDW